MYHCETAHEAPKQASDQAYGDPSTALGQYSLAIALWRSAADNLQQCCASSWFLLDRAQVCEVHLPSLIAHASPLIGFACCGDAPGGGALGGDMTADGDIAEEPERGMSHFLVWNG